jgi:hypothetical protein
MAPSLGRKPNPCAPPPGGTSAYNLKYEPPGSAWLVAARRGIHFPTLRSTFVSSRSGPGARDIAGRASNEQRARWLDAELVKGEPVWLGPWLVSACGFGCYDRVEVDAYASSCALPELSEQFGHHADPHTLA